MKCDTCTIKSEKHINYLNCTRMCNYKYTMRRQKRICDLEKIPNKIKFLLLRTKLKTNEAMTLKKWILEILESEE